MGKKLVMLTAWDYPTAKILEQADVDYILVGDSLSMTILGYKDTKSITVEEMVHHVRAVARGAKKTPIIADMPAGTYRTPKIALENAQKLLAAGATMIKTEGYKPDVVAALINNSIDVVGHLGLLPQTASAYRVYGKEKQEAKKILSEAKGLDRLGIKLLVLECIPVALAKKITKTITTPTVGIGAGPYCSGQVLVFADTLGLSDFTGRMVKRYAPLKEIMLQVAKSFKSDVEKGKFPAKENSFE